MEGGDGGEKRGGYYGGRRVRRKDGGRKMFNRGETPLYLHNFGLPSWAASVAQLVEHLASACM